MSFINPISLAFAEDQPLFRNGLAYTLSLNPRFNLLCGCENGEVLLQTLDKAQQKPDVCLLDIRMPVLDGYQSASAIRKKYPAIKIIALSSHHCEFNIIKMVRNGAMGYLMKDIEPHVLFNAIIDVYNGHYYIPTEMAASCIHISKGAIDESRYHLSDRELEFIGLCCSELTYKQIADKMKVTLRTVDGYREHVFEKLETGCRTGIVLFAIKAGLVAVF